MPSIKSIKAIQVFDSRGTPTISCRVDLENGATYTSMVPSGASTGSREALELRDGGSNYLGKGVQTAVNNIHNKIAPALIGMDVNHQRLIDETMIALDGSDTKSNLGANAILGVSLAVLGAGANFNHIPIYQYVNKIYSDINGVMLDMNLPIPMLNIINGGEHADNNIDIQEFMIMPIGASSFSEGMQWSTEIYAGLKKLLQDKNLSTGVGDEGGFAPNLKSNNEAIELIMQAI
ncbi:MAG: phosphopyruvate hydratase, partial [Proteobacteria bacterium]|nr:phosphopyruvate hydratase [Pseudomonadota bacterium]